MRRHLLLPIFSLLLSFSSISYGEHKTHHLLINKTNFTIEIAKTPEERRNGLMFRETLADHHGMLFLFDQDDIHSFWMHNTLISLDIIWIGANKKIVYIHENAKPFDDTPLTPSQKSRFVLEVPAGTVKKYHLVINDKITLQ
ncbi:MAG: DUF192 domain-containing protein [Candidatus Margulisbacteria bacterium]|nr:DUF192 domain-containing protein [Candidatus Margulisiibacteriota bacterium]